jgi:hypothetical protein
VIWRVEPPGANRLRPDSGHRPDRKVVFTGSNNFSGSGFITNEENSVMLRSPANTTRISWFICDIDKMFDIGVEAGKPQLSDAARKTALLALDQCNGAEVWFPPTDMTANGASITFDHVLIDEDDRPVRRCSTARRTTRRARCSTARCSAGRIEC